MPPIEVYIPGRGSTGELPEVPGVYPSQDEDQKGSPVFTVRIPEIKRKGPNGQGEIKLVQMEIIPFSREKVQTAHFNGRSYQSLAPEAEITFPGGQEKARVIYHRKK